MTAHTVDAVGVIKIRSLFTREDAISRTVIHADIAVDAVAIRYIRFHPDKWCN